MRRFRAASLTIAAVISAACTLMLVGNPAHADGTCVVGPNNELICGVGVSTGASTPAPPPVAPPTVNNGSGSAPQGGAEGVAATTGASSNNPGQVGGECAWRVLNPPPPPGDPLWEGHNGATGVVLYNLCNGPIAYTFAANLAAAPPAPLPPPDPAVLAQQAYAQLIATLTKPTVGRSPDPNHGDPAKGGEPYTVVNLWTRYFTDPTTFVKMSKTVSLRGVSVTVTATPVALSFDPGDGNDLVSCPGPGRAWQDSDGFDPPAAGECGYRYKKVEASPITATEAIRWTVGWTDPAGRAHQFPDQSTQVSSQLIVEQIQIVVKN